MGCSKSVMAQGRAPEPRQKLMDPEHLHQCAVELEGKVPDHRSLQYASSSSGSACRDDFSSEAAKKSLPLLPRVSTSDLVASLGVGPLDTPKRRSSQKQFASSRQTIIVFDWDDTLFPTSYIRHELKVNIDRLWEKNMFFEAQTFPPGIRQKLAVCEDFAVEILQRGRTLAHVVVITLATRGWVEYTCKTFFPAVWASIEGMSIPILYAQEKQLTHELNYITSGYTKADWERYWGLMKGRAISEEAEAFYSQYEGQSWKNILSIGDSTFERYGLLAATSAYMQGQTVDRDATPASTASPVWSPSEDGCWEKVDGHHIKRLRAKCCKLVDSPNVDALTTELETLLDYLEDMVKFDNGFDVNFEELGIEGLEAKFRKHSLTPCELWRKFLECFSVARCIPCR